MNINNNISKFQYRYRDKIVDYGMIKIYAMASVLETKQTWSEEEDLQLEKPRLDVQVFARFWLCAK